MSAYKGIDWTVPGSQVNRDSDTGIRYGVISQHSVGQAWYDDAEADYGTPHCPKCGNDAIAIMVRRGNSTLSYISDK